MIHTVASYLQDLIRAVYGLRFDHMVAGDNSSSNGCQSLSHLLYVLRSAENDEIQGISCEYSPSFAFAPLENVDSLHTG